MAGDPGIVWMVVSCGGARKGQKGKKSGVRNKENIMGAIVPFLFHFCVIF